MKVSVKEVSDIARRIHVELPEDRVNQHLKKAYRQLNRTVKVKGFRPGKVPLAILKRNYADQVNYDVGLELINETLTEAMKQAEIQAVSQSDLDREPLHEGEPFRYSFLVEIKPDITVTDYEKMPAHRPRLQISDEDVDAELELRRQVNAYLKSLEQPRPLQREDHAVLDFRAFVEGKPVTDGEVRGFHLEVGSNSFNPDFESKLIGANKGDQREIEVTFPADHGNRELAGNKTTFQVHVRDIKVKVLPDLDDGFAKDLGEFETLDELRSAVRQELEVRERAKVEAEVRKQLLDQLIDRNPFVVPTGMVEQELQRMLDTVRYRLSAQNLTLEQAGLDENTFKERNREVAEKKVRTSILLEKIAEQEELEVTDEELDEGLRRNAEEMKQPFEKVRDFYQKSNLMEPLRRQLIEEKVMKLLNDQADVTEVDRGNEDGKNKQEEDS